MFIKYFETADDVVEALKAQVAEEFKVLHIMWTEQTMDPDLERVLTGVEGCFYVTKATQADIREKTKGIGFVWSVNGDEGLEIDLLPGKLYQNCMVGMFNPNPIGLDWS